MIAIIIIIILSITLILLGVSITYQGFNEYNLNNVSNPPAHWMVGFLFGMLSFGLAMFLLFVILKHYI